MPKNIFKITKYLPENIIYSLMPIYKKIFYKSKKSKLFKIYKHFIQKNDLVFDIGAFVGDYSTVFIKIGAKVVALEANPKLIKILKNRFKKQFINHH